MLKHLKTAAFATVALLIAGSAIAANVNLFSSTLGDLIFPFAAPSVCGSGTCTTPGTIDNMTIGATTPRAGSFTTLTNTTPGAGSFTSLTASGQITSTAGLPTIASGACGTTTNGAIVAGSTNQSGQITIGSAATTTCTVSFSATLAVKPNMCVFSPMNAAAIAATTLPFMSAPTTGGFVLNGAVLASTNWGYVCL